MVSNSYIEQLLQRLSSSDADKSKFSAFYNLVLLPLAQISEPVEYRLKDLESKQSLLNPDSLSEAEMDAYCANHLIFRKQGNTGTATAKLVVRRQNDLTIEEGTVVYIELNGTRYSFKFNGVLLKSTDFTVSPNYGQYFVSSPVQLTTLDTKEGYNTIAVGSVLKFDSNLDSNIVYVVLDSIGTKVLAKETNRELYNRLLQSIGSKTLGHEAGIRNLMTETYPEVPVVSIFGNNDPEVTRNKIEFFTPDTGEEWQTLTFKGKKSGDNSIAHTAYEYLLTDIDEYAVSDGAVVLNGLAEFMLNEASDKDYSALQLRYNEAFFETGHNVYMAKENFLTDPEWNKVDAFLGTGLHSSDEITVDGNSYVLGASLTQIDYANFIRDLMAAKGN